MADEIAYGPAMAALTEMQRRFVLAMASDPFGGQKKWAIAAGYSDVKDGAKVRGHELMHHPKIEAAVLEVGRSMLGGVGPIIAAHAIIRAASNPKSKNHLRAAEMLANRVGLHEVQEISVTKRDLTGDALIERLKLLAGSLGIDPAALLGVNAAPKLIEVNPDRSLTKTAGAPEREGVVDAGENPAGQGQI